MNKKLFLGILLASVLVISVVAPATAKKESKVLEKMSFIHFKKSFVKPINPGKPVKESSCYEFMKKGLVWKSVEDYFVNPTNNYGLSENFIFNATALSVNEWEFYGGNIFGEQYSTTSFSGIYDGRNVISFGDYAQEGVIAVATVWGYFNVPPKQREIIEFDITLDTDFVWGLGEDGLMDVQNILTHELGHAVGMADLYDTVCSNETMYGYSEYGDIEKRTLGSGDIAGIQKLYN